MNNLIKAYAAGVMSAAFLFGSEGRVRSESDRVRGEDPWHLLQWAQVVYEREEFGDTLRYAQRARALRREQVEHQCRVLLRARTRAESAGIPETLSDLYALLKSRGETDACEVLDAIFLTHAPHVFQNSVSKLLQWLKDSAAFPEAELLLGKVFEGEGEYAQALQHYRNAWDTRAQLVVPDARFDIIYAMANVSRLLSQQDEREKYLLLVLSEDPLYSAREVWGKTLHAMLRTIRSSNTVEKFFKLYRHRNVLALRAYQELTEMYVRTDNIERALPVSVLAADIAISALDSFLQKIELTYQYKDLADLFLRTGSHPTILKWANEHGVWQTLLHFADLLYKKGLHAQARDMYYNLAEKCPAFEYARRAAYKISLTL